MRLSDAQIKSLQALLKSELGLDYAPEQTHEAGMAIIRFVLAKYQRSTQLNDNKGDATYV